jgi:hypothetical protein
MTESTGVSYPLLTIYTGSLWDDDAQFGSAARHIAVSAAVAPQGPLGALQHTQQERHSPPQRIWCASTAATRVNSRCDAISLADHTH